MNNFKFGARSEKNLQGVHPDLVKVIRESLKRAPYDFAITEGVRTPERQLELYNAGKSLTLKSRHLGGFAVDILAYVNGKGTWENKYYDEIAKVIKTVAIEMKVPIIYGGDWRSLVDSVHFEVDRRFYPDKD